MSKTPKVVPEDGPVAPKTLRFVEVTWLDAVAGNSWAPLHGEPDAVVAKCLTRGWIVKEDEQQIIICATLGFNADGLVEDVNTTIAIPKGMVSKLTDFPPPRRRRKPEAPANG